MFDLRDVSLIVGTVEKVGEGIVGTVDTVGIFETIERVREQSEQSNSRIEGT